MTQRRDKDASRARLLEAGREEFIAARTASATELLAHLRLENIAERAGYSGPGMIYNLWKDPEREQALGITPRELYLRDLLVEVANAPYRNNTITKTMVQIMAQSSHEVEFIRAVTNHEHMRITTGLNETYLPFWSLISGLQVSGVAEGLEQVERVALEDLAAMYEVGLTHYGFQMKPPLTSMHLALSLRSVQSGFAETYAIHTEEHDALSIAEWLGSADWTLFGIASHAVIEAMTEPITPSETSAD